MCSRPYCSNCTNQTNQQTIFMYSFFVQKLVFSAQVPVIKLYSKVLYSALLSTDIIYIFSSILLLVGVTCKRLVLVGV